MMRLQESNERVVRSWIELYEMEKTRSNDLEIRYEQVIFTSW